MPYYGDSADNTLDDSAELVWVYHYGAAGRDLLLFGNKTSADPRALWSVYIEGGPGDDVLTGNTNLDAGDFIL